MELFKGSIVSVVWALGLLRARGGGATMDDEVKSEFSKVLKTIQGVGTRVSALEEHTKALEVQTKALESHARSTDARLGRLEKDLGDVKTTLGRYERRLDSIDRR